MVLTLLLCAGLVASAPQDTAPMRASFEQNSERSDLVYLQDTTRNTGNDSSRTMLIQSSQEMDFTLTLDDGKTYLIKGGKLIHAGDTVLLSPKAKAALEKLSSIQMKGEGLPAMAPMPPMPAMAPMPPMPPIPPIPMTGFEIPPFPIMEGFEVPSQVFEGMLFQSDTTKMSKAEKEKWRKSVKEGAENWSKEFEMKAQEWEEKFQKEFAPKLKEFEEKMKEWEKSNEPRMKEFESKMKAWEESQGPKLKAFEEIIKQWELANQPRMEEFQKRMEVWQKEQQARRQEFQLLLQEELKKGKN
jgi:hypothetical protein